MNKSYLLEIKTKLARLVVDSHYVYEEGYRQGLKDDMAKWLLHAAKFLEEKKK